MNLSLPEETPAQSVHRPATLAAGDGNRTAMDSTHTHADLELNFVHEGRVGYFMSGRFVELQAGQLAVFWAAMPHRVVEVDERSRFTYVHVPLTTFFRWKLPSAFVTRVLSGNVVVDTQSPAWDAEVSQRWLEDLRSGEAALALITELEIEARVRRFAFRRPIQTADQLPMRQDQVYVLAIASFLEQNFHEDLALADVARTVALSPNYAMTVFRRACGMTIWQYLMRLRLSHAQLMLLTTEMSVSTIARRSGFTSVPRFYAAFHDEFGVSPLAFRKRRC